MRVLRRSFLIAFLSASISCSVLSQDAPPSNSSQTPLTVKIDEDITIKPPHPKPTTTKKLPPDPEEKKPEKPTNPTSTATEPALGATTPAASSPEPSKILLGVFTTQHLIISICVFGALAVLSLMCIVLIQCKMCCAVEIEVVAGDDGEKGIISQF